MTEKISIWDKVDRSVTKLAERSVQGNEPPSEAGATAASGNTEASARLESPWPKRLRLPRDILCYIVWTYVLVQLFVVNVDSMVIDKVAPDYARYLNFKILIIGAVCWLGLLLFRAKFLLFLVYLTFFPFVFVFWKIPRALFRMGTVLPLVAITNLISNLVTRFWYHVGSKAIWMVAVVVVLTTHIAVLLVPAMFAIGVILLIAYYRTIREALRPSEFLRAHEAAVSKFSEFSAVKQLTSLNAELRNDQLELFSQQQLNEFSSALGMALIVNRGVYFWAHQLDRYRRSSFPLLFSMGSYVVLFIATVLSLSAINLGLLHLDANSFTYSESPSVLQVIHHSMASLYVNSVPGIDPASDAAIFVSVIGGFIGIILLSTVIANFVYSATNRDNEALKDTIERIKAEGERLEGRLIEEYEVSSYEDAVDRLQRLGNGLVGVVTFLARQVPDDLGHRGT